jgi:uncharacterized protein (DUF305 family)
MAPIRFRTILGCVAVAGMALTSACSGAGEHSDRGSAAVTKEEANPHKAADVTFARDMVAHHHQAIDLANLVFGRSTNQAVIGMANNISAQQLPEVAALTALLVQWNEDGGSSDQGMPGMVDPATMSKLETLTGAPFDKLWLQSMISHHEGAITMSKAEIADGQNSDMIAMAKNIIAVQQAEIDQMKQILGG